MSIACDVSGTVAVCDAVGTVSLWPARKPASVLDCKPEPSVRMHAHAVHDGEFYTLARTTAATTLTHMPSNHILLLTPNLCLDFVIKDANTAYILTASGAYEVSLVTPKRAPAVTPPPALGPPVAVCGVLGNGSTPRCCAWDPTRQVLYLAATGGEVLAWSPGADGCTPRLLRRLEGALPLQLAVDQATGWLVVLLSGRPDRFIVLSPSGAVGVISRAASQSLVTGFCIVPRSAVRGPARRAAGVHPAGGAWHRGSTEGGWRTHSNSFTWLTLRGFIIAVAHGGAELHARISDSIAFEGFSGKSFQQSVAPASVRQHSDGMLHALSSGDFSDVSLQCSDGTLVPAHRMILAARFPYFSALLSRRWAAHSAPCPDSGTDEPVVPSLAAGAASSSQPVPSTASPDSPAGTAGATPLVAQVDAAPVTVRSIRRWAYTGAFAVSDTGDAAAIAALGDLWCAPAVKAQCEEWLIQQLAPGNMAGSLHLAGVLSMPALRTAALGRIGDEWEGLTKDGQTAITAALAQSPSLMVEVIGSVLLKKRKRVD